MSNPPLQARERLEQPAVHAWPRHAARPLLVIVITAWDYLFPSAWDLRRPRAGCGSLTGFPLYSIPRLGTVAAVGTSLFLETSGFGTGLDRYLRMHLVDIQTAKSIILITLPLGAIGAVAAVTHLTQLVMEGGLSAIPWNLLVWAVPGSVAGAHLGTRFQGRVSERAARRFFAALFAAIGLVFLLAFTVFRSRFG